MNFKNTFLLASIVVGAVMGLQVNAMTIKDASYFEKYTVASTKILQQKLTTQQYQVTQLNKTDPAYMKTRSYLNNKQEGIYVDVVSGEPLFSSTDKYDSGTGWPAFTKPISADIVQEKVDDSLGVIRTEVRSTTADSHLGHIFDDGPAPGGLRYCINSSALHFISSKYMEQLGYGEYLYLFN